MLGIKTSLHVFMYSSDMTIHDDDDMTIWTLAVWQSKMFQTIFKIRCQWIFVSHPWPITINPNSNKKSQSFQNSFLFHKKSAIFKQQKPSHVSLRSLCPPSEGQTYGFGGHPLTGETAVFFQGWNAIVFRKKGKGSNRSKTNPTKKKWSHKRLITKCLVKKCSPLRKDLIDVNHFIDLFK